LPRKKQILWVAAPYAVVLFLVLLLIFLKEPSKAGATVIAPVQAAQMQAPPVQPAAPAPAPVQQAQPAAVLQQAQAPAQAAPDQPAEKRDAIKALIDKTEGDVPLAAPNERSARIARSVWKTVPIAASLRVKPDQN